MTVNDVPKLRRMLRWARLKGVPVSYTLPGAEARKAAKELIITAP